MNIYIGIEINKDIKRITLCGIGNTEEKALKYSTEEIKKAFPISNPPLFFDNLTTWLNEEANMVGSELMDSIEMIRIAIMKLKDI